MSAITEYNGWLNRETWLVNLWLTNEQSLYEMLCHIKRTCERLEDQAHELENFVRSGYVYDEDKATMWSDLLNTALRQVSWLEIVENNQ